MLKKRCLILDYDDTLVKSTGEIHYPAFINTLSKMRPGESLTMKEYTELDFKIGFVNIYKQLYNFTDEEIEIEEQMWRDFAKEHSPALVPGMDKIVKKQREEGGLVVVMSHSLKEFIEKTFKRYSMPMPDKIYGWDEKEYVKPKPDGVYELIKLYNLKPEDIILIDDLKPGYMMARETNITFAYASWAETKTEYIEDFMKTNADVYLNDVEDLYNYLFE